MEFIKLGDHYFSTDHIVSILSREGVVRIFLSDGRDFQFSGEDVEVAAVQKWLAKENPRDLIKALGQPVKKAFEGFGQGTRDSE